MTRTYRITYSIFLCLSFIVSALMWYQVRVGFNSVTLSDLGWSVFLVVCAMALFVLSLLVFSLSEVFWIFTVFLAGFLVLLPFHMAYLLAAVLAFLVFVYAAIEMRKSIRERLNISFYAFLLYGVPSLLTALALLFAFAGYFYPFNLDHAQVSSSTFSYMMPAVERLASVKFPYYHSGMTVDEFFSASAQEIVKTQFGAIPKQAQALVKSEAIKQRDALGKQLGVEMTGKETITDLFVTVTNSYLKRYLHSYRDFVPIAVALSVFLSIKSLGFLIDRFAVFSAWLVSRALVASGVMVKQKVPAERESFIIV